MSRAEVTIRPLLEQVIGAGRARVERAARHGKDIAAPANLAVINEPER